MSKNNPNFVLNPSDFAFLWQECKRCFYLKVVRGFPRPRIVLPRIFNVIDSTMKEHFAGKTTGEQMPFLPPGLVDNGTEWVESIPLTIPGVASTFTIRGKIDTLIRFDNGTYGVIDFKTSGVTSRTGSSYSHQLHAYATALENAASGNLSLSPVTTLGLVVFEPNEFSTNKSRDASLRGEVKWVHIPRDDAAFKSFVAQVIAVLDSPSPPENAPTCEWCIYRESSRKIGL